MNENEKMAAEEIVRLQKEVERLETQLTDLSIVATVVTCLLLIGYCVARILV